MTNSCANREVFRVALDDSYFRSRGQNNPFASMRGVYLSEAEGVGMTRLLQLILQIPTT
jgi:hypothetical protein